MRKNNSFFQKKEPEARINEAIRAREVRVLDQEGAMLGVMPTKEALDRALAEELDLIEVAPNANPPVCKIMDYGKYKYEEDKKKKKQKAQTKKIDLKIVRFSLIIGEHDLEIKAKSAYKFLIAGHKVRLELALFGRQKQHVGLVEPLFKKFMSKLDSINSLEKEKINFLIEQPFERQAFKFSMLLRTK